MNTITEDAFYADYRPIKNPRGTDDQWEMKDLEDAHLIHEDPQTGLIPMDDPDFRRIWTVCSEGDDWTAAPGFHRVNRMYYMVTEVPWPDEQPMVIFDGPTCDYCGKPQDEEADRSWNGNTGNHIRCEIEALVTARVAYDTAGTQEDRDKAQRDITHIEWEIAEGKEYLADMEGDTDDEL